ncbi:MAG: hypothetical protein KAG66_22250, partial [Methylococcales bacterium]|nr:hypothetical protein [Methylococcales bacterium]
MVRSLIVKSDDIADQIHYNDIVTHPTIYSELTPRAEFRYFQHLAGNITEVDEPMEIFSIDTQSLISFNSSINGHALTSQRLRADQGYLSRLIATYPTQERLIRGILNPISLEKSLSVNDSTILYYDKTWVETQEFELMEKVQDHIINMDFRWKIAPYVNIDEYYLGIHTTMVFLSIIPKVLNYREDVLGTVQAHSFHIDEFLISNGVNVDLSYLNIKQKFFLYRNLKYIKKHTGHDKTFNMLVKGLVEPGRIPLDTHIVTHRHTPDGMVEPLFKSTPLLPQFRSHGQYEKNAEQYRNLEIAYRELNQLVPLSDLEEQVNSSKYGMNYTKLLESSLSDSSNGGSL